MINQVTLNSNNATDMSRVELISWLNQLISFNVQRIQQLGSGVAYCYLMDLLYPGKIAIGKVNTKAKFEYEFICNFKILQQSFTKLGIMKNIEVQKLIKCKYQDNLEFLQWFKKIFDSNIISGKDYNSLIKKTDEEVIYKRKQQTQRNNHQNVSKDYLNLSDHFQRSFLRSKSFYNTERSDQNDSLRFPSSVVSSSHYKIKEVQNQKLLQSPYYDSEKQKLIKQESQLHLKKIMMIEGLMQVWDTARRSQQLIEEINIILKCKDLKFLEQYKEISGIIKSDCLMIDNQ